MAATPVPEPRQAAPPGAGAAARRPMGGPCDNALERVMVPGRDPAADLKALLAERASDRASDRVQDHVFHEDVSSHPVAARAHPFVAQDRSAPPLQAVLHAPVVGCGGLEAGGPVPPGAVREKGRLPGDGSPVAPGRRKTSPPTRREGPGDPQLRPHRIQKEKRAGQAEPFQSASMALISRHSVSLRHLAGLTRVNKCRKPVRTQPAGYRKPCAIAVFHDSRGCRTGNPDRLRAIAPGHLPFRGNGLRDSPVAS